MTSRTDAIGAPAAAGERVVALGWSRRRALDFLELTKPRVVLMVLVTTATGYHLGAASGQGYASLWHALVGTALAAAGALALNEFLERDVDARMARTRRRPLPDGRVAPPEALLFGTLLVGGGILYLALTAGRLPALVTALTAGLYLFAYTPLKRVTPLCTVAGAVPGALPPVAGWAAARGTLGIDVAVVFAILFLWQLPHTLAIARLHREDYARAGIRLLPVVDPDGSATERQIVTACLALQAAGLLPTLVGLTGPVYFVGALALGGAFLACGLAQALAPSAEAARRLVVASVVYLPALLALMALDKAG